MTLGPLETEIMNILWGMDEGDVWQVRSGLSKKVAYTTVMTTMVRLFRKGLLKRRKQGHGFRYTAQLSSEQWARMSASEALTRFMATPNATREVLISCLAGNIFKHDRKLLLEVSEALTRQPRANSASAHLPSNIRRS
jgi:predicted transcriptional regulator